MVDRRQFIKSVGVATTAGIAGFSGCMGGNTGGGDETPTEESTPKPYGDGALDFSMSPSEPQDLMMKQYEPVKEYLSEEVQKTKLTYAKDYAAVVQALGSGTGDVAETGPFAAALGVNDDKAEIGLQRFAYGSWEYTSVITTKKDSDIESLADLEGKKVALADRLSASGSLYPLYMLKQAGLNIGDLPTGGDANADFDAQYAGGHGAAWAALENDQVAAAGTGQFITVTGDDRTLAEGYEYVKAYDGIPRAPIVLSPKLSGNEKEAVVDAFKNAPDEMYLGADGEEGSDDDLWFSDVRPADVATYSPVINVAEELGISLEDL
jgi:phosphonate transport system substrate-binding protein